MPVTAAIIHTAAARMANAVAYNSEAATSATADLSDQQIAETVVLLGAECHMLGFVLQDARHRFEKPISTLVQSLPQDLLDAISQVLVACEMTTSVTTRGLDEIQSGMQHDSDDYHQVLMSSASKNIHAQASMLSLLLRAIDSPSPEYTSVVLKSNRAELESLKFEAASLQADTARETMSHSALMPPPLHVARPSPAVLQAPPSLPVRERVLTSHSDPNHSRAVSAATLDSFPGFSSDSGSLFRLPSMVSDARSMISEVNTEKEVVLPYESEKEVVPIEKEATFVALEDNRSYRSRYPKTSTFDLKAIQKKTGVPLIGISAVYPHVSQIQACGPHGLQYSELAMANRDFNVATLSHTMTMTLMAIFISRGDFTWDEPVTRALPSMAPATHKSHYDTTLGMIGSHASGLTQTLDGLKDEGMWSVLKDPKTSSQQARRAIISTYLAQRAPTRPGSDSVPRHVNGMIIALILEEHTGKPFDKLIATELFKPLDMTSAKVGVEIPNDPNALWLRQVESSHAIGFTRPDNADSSHFGSTLGGLPYIGPGAIAALYPGAGMACPLGDLAKFLTLHVDGASGHKTPILGTADFDQLHRKVPGLLSTYGGWFEQGMDAKHSWITGRRLLSHSKGVGFTVRCEIAPGAHAAFACVVNGSGQEASMAASAGLDLCFDELMPKSPASASSGKSHGMFKRRWTKNSFSS